MRRAATWLVLAAVGIVAIAGLVDAVHRSSSRSESAHPDESTIDALTVTTPSERVATVPPAITQQAIAAQSDTTAAAATTAHFTEVVSPERLPSCALGQLSLTFTVWNGLEALELRRVGGTPCHHGRSLIGFTVRNQSGDRVAVFGGSRTARPADFTHGFQQLIDFPDLFCDADGSFMVVGTVGPYAARRTVPGKRLKCDHG